INEISDAVCRGVEHSDSDDSDKSDSSDSEDLSEDEQKPKNSNHNNSVHKDSKKRPRPPSAQGQDQDAAPPTTGGTPGGDKKSTEPQTKEKLSGGVEKDSQEKSKPLQQTQKKSQPGQDVRPAGSEQEVDSDSERELVIDLGEEPGGREKKKAKRETPSAPISTTKDQTGIKTD
ncbi:hypothetical protein M9458_046680, partial [Cirrhinus mrigala]